MTHISMISETVLSPTSGLVATSASQGAEAATQAGSHFLINPWLGLIGLSVLVITGAIAVIREIRIEDEENNS